MNIKGLQYLLCIECIKCNGSFKRIGYCLNTKAFRYFGMLSISKKTKRQ
jgi:hypothetical protein